MVGLAAEFLRTFDSWSACCDEEVRMDPFHAHCCLRLHDQTDSNVRRQYAVVDQTDKGDAKSFVAGCCAG